MTSTKKRITIALATAILTINLTTSVTAAGTPSIRISSYKGSNLDVGERSSLIISSGGTEYTIASNDPDIVAVERVLTFWVAITKAEGAAEITATNGVGGQCTITLTVGPIVQTAPAIEYDTSLTDNLEIRLEMIRLINQTRKANGVSELSVNNALMTAAQVCSDRRYTWHHTQEECEVAAAAGYPYGFGDNLAVFTGTADAAQHAVNNWINSPGHFQTMIDPNCDCIGVGVTQHDGITYCYMFVGIPTSVSFYA